MSVVPLANNRRVEIKIQPWAIQAADSSRPTSVITSLWFTTFNPLHANSKGLEIQAGTILANLPDSLLKLALFEASRWADAISKPPCTNPNLEYFAQIRYRYVILKALEYILGEIQGAVPVKRKLLGDFEIEFDTRNSDANLMTRVLNELAKLEPIVMSGGCLGIGAGYGPVVTVKGANDPNRLLVSREWYEPDRGSSGIPNEIVSSGVNRNREFIPDRYRRSHNRNRGGRQR